MPEPGRMREPQDPPDLERFYRTVRDIPGVSIQLAGIPSLLSRFLVRLPEPGYRVKPAMPFEHGDFTRSFLSEAELDRLNGFKVLKKQVEWCCGRFAAKTLAKEVLMPDTALADIEIDYRPQGAPFLADFPEFSLSLSHAGELTAAALARVKGSALGIDVEVIGPMPDNAFMRTAFTPEERRAMPRTPEAVFRCWTLKEAYLKYIQKGFNESLHRVEVIGERIRHNGIEQPVRCRSWEPLPGYRLGLVTPC